MDKGKSIKSCCEKLAQHLKCAVCTKLSKGPVKQCINGHICCSNCADHDIRCCICASPFDLKNATVSQILDKSVVLCQFKNFGCSKVLNPLEYDDHVESCSFRRIQCKICTQQLMAFRFRNHILRRHRELSWMTDDNKLCWRNFDFNKDSQNTEIVQAFDQLFWYCFSYNMQDQSFNIAVQFIGPKPQAESYAYEIDSGPSSHGNRIFFTRSTHYYMDASANIFRTDGFSIRKNILTAMSKDNVFVLRLKIVQIQGEIQQEEN